LFMYYPVAHGFVIVSIMSIPIHRLGLEVYTSPKVLSTSLKVLALEIDYEPLFSHLGFSNLKAVSGLGMVHELYPTKPFNTGSLSAKLSKLNVTRDPLDRLASLYRSDPLGRLASRYQQRALRNGLAEVLEFRWAEGQSVVSRDGYVKIGFVRDPLDRLASLYRNRVIIKQWNEATQWLRASKLELDVNPSFEHFVENLGAYQKALPSVKHHSASQVTYLGSDPQFYDHLYSDKEIQNFEAFLSLSLRRPTALVFSNKSDQIIPLGINSKVINKVRDIYEQDYEVFGEILGRKPDQQLPKGV